MLFLFYLSQARMTQPFLKSLFRSWPICQKCGTSQTRLTSPVSARKSWHSPIKLITFPGLPPNTSQWEICRIDCTSDFAVRGTQGLNRHTILSSNVIITQLGVCGEGKVFQISLSPKYRIWDLDYSRSVNFSVCKCQWVQTGRWF